MKSALLSHASYQSPSLPVRGAWIEILNPGDVEKVPQSLPVRGAWIEIVPAEISPLLPPSRSPCGERGLKYGVLHFSGTKPGRSPCGERGLKSASRPSLWHHDVAPRAGSVD